MIGKSVEKLDEECVHGTLIENCKTGATQIELHQCLQG